MRVKFCEIVTKFEDRPHYLFCLGVFDFKLSNLLNEDLKFVLFKGKNKSKCALLCCCCLLNILKSSFYFTRFYYSAITRKKQRLYLHSNFFVLNNCYNTCVLFAFFIILCFISNYFLCNNNNSSKLADLAEYRKHFCFEHNDNRTFRMMQ